MGKKSITTTGTTFEARIKAVCDCYLASGRAYFEKVDPPTVKTQYRTIYKDNPFLDFVGSWIERGGQSIHIEAKSNSKTALPISADKDGVSVEQIESLEKWQAANAAVGILWEHKGEVRFVTLAMMEDAKAENIKSVPWARAYRIPKGAGAVEFDFLAILTVLYPCIPPFNQAKVPFPETENELWPNDHEPLKPRP